MMCREQDDGSRGKTGVDFKLTDPVPVISTGPIFCNLWTGALERRAAGHAGDPQAPGLFYPPLGPRGGRDSRHPPQFEADQM